MNFTSAENSPSVEGMSPAAAVATVLAGLAAGASLIIAIGAQNAYVLRQGLRREHVLPIVLICIASDAILNAAGVAGIGAIIRSAPVALEILRWAGFAFRLLYAAFSARRALRPEHLDPKGAAATSTTLRAA